MIRISMPITRGSSSRLLLRCFLATLLGLYAAAHLVTLDRFPLVWMDEPWYTQPAWNFAVTGRFSQPMFSGLYGQETSNVVYGRIYLLLDAAVFKLLGLGPFQARLVSLLAGLVLILLTYRIGTVLWGHRSGIFASVLLAVSQSFVFQAHDARPEMLLTAFLAGALLLALESERPGGTLFVGLAGLVAGLAADIHMNGLIVPFVVGAVLLYRVGLRALAGVRGAAYALGVLTALIWWLILHVAPDPGLFWSQWRGFWAQPLPVQSLVEAPLQTFTAEAARYVNAALGSRGAVVLPATAIIASIWLLIRHRDRSTLTLLVTVSCTYLAMMLVVANKTGSYAILLWPIAALLVARFAVRLGSRIGPLALFGVACLSLIGTAIPASRQSSADYEAYISHLRRFVPEGAVVQGQPVIWYGFASHPFIADHYFEFVGPYEEAMRARGIEVIVADEFFLTQQLRVERSIDAQEVDAFLRDHTVLAGTVWDRFYGGSGGSGEGPFATRIYWVTDP